MKVFANDEDGNRRLFAQHFGEIVASLCEDVVVVVDADETLSTTDTSSIFWGTVYGADAWASLRSDFRRLGRTYAGYFNAAQIYSSISADEYISRCDRSSKQVCLRPGWAEFIESLPAAIIVTSGIRLLWQQFINSMGWNHVRVLGGNHATFDEFIVDPNIKLDVVVRLHALGKKVIAFGDSLADAPMLMEADLGIVVANERRSPGLVEALSGASHTYQLDCGSAILHGLASVSFSEVRGKHEFWRRSPDEVGRQ